MTMMKKLAWLAMMALPLVVMADVPGREPAPRPYLSLRRIGYEIFPELNQFPDCVFQQDLRVYLMLAVAVLIGAFVLGVLIRGRRSRWGMITLWAVVLIVPCGVMVMGRGCNLRTGGGMPMSHAEPEWNAGSDEIDRAKKRAELVSDDLYNAIVELVNSWKRSALKLYSTPLEEIEDNIPAEIGIGRNEVLGAIRFPDVLEPLLHNKRYRYAYDSMNYDSYWGVRGFWGNEKKSKWGWEGVCAGTERNGYGCYDRDRYSKLRSWLQKLSSPIPKTWMPPNVKSDEDLIRECLTRSPELRSRCIGIPIEYFGGFDFDLFRGWRGWDDEN